jgi:hypothetical protein
MAGVRIKRLETAIPTPQIQAVGATCRPKAAKVAKKTTIASKLRTIAPRARLVDF